MTVAHPATLAGLMTGAIGPDAIEVREHTDYVNAWTALRAMPPGDPGAEALLRSRLVNTLFDVSYLAHATQSVILKAGVTNVDPEHRSFSFTASVELVDQQDEVVKLDGMKLDTFLANPTMLLDHDAKQPFARVTSLRRTTRHGVPALVGEAHVLPAGMSNRGTLPRGPARAPHSRPPGFTFPAGAEPATSMNQNGGCITGVGHVGGAERTGLRARSGPAVRPPSLHVG